MKNETGEKQLYHPLLDPNLRYKNREEIQLDRKLIKASKLDGIKDGGQITVKYLFLFLHFQALVNSEFIDWFHNECLLNLNSYVKLSTQTKKYRQDLQTG